MDELDKLAICAASVLTRYFKAEVRRILELVTESGLVRAD